MFFLRFTTPTSPKTYYVSPNGSGNVCTNSNPCSLSYYQSDDYTGTKSVNLGPGDVLYLKSGTYTRQARLDFSTSGTSEAPIVITTAPGEATKAILSGDVNRNKIVDEFDGPRAPDPVRYHQWTPLVRIRGNYVTFRDIEIAFSGGRGIQTEGSYNVLSGLNVHHTWNNAIHISGSNSLVENNVVWRGAESNYCGGIGGSRGCNGDWPAAVAWGESGGSTSPGKANHITVRGNTVYNNSGEGILCMHTDHSVVENNVVYDNWGLGIDLDKCGYATVQKNLIYYTSDKNWWRKTDSTGNPIRPGSGILISNEYTRASGNTYPLGHDRKIINNIIVGAGSGITFWPGDGSGGEFDRSRLINDVIAFNTIVEAQNGGTGITIMQPPLAGLSHTNTRIANNVILQSNGVMAEVDTPAGITCDHNLWSRMPPTNVQGVGDVYADPQLADPSHIRVAGSVDPSWYKLLSSSPAINAGVALTDINTDHWGSLRAVDIGAHEYSIPITPTPVSEVSSGDHGDDKTVWRDIILWLIDYLLNTVRNLLE